MTEQSSKEQITQVTQPKHPGRVAQGKRLAELMKKRKEELLKNSKSELKSEQESELKSEQESELKEQQPTRSYNHHIYGVGALSILAIAICVYFYLPRETKTANESRLPQGTAPAKKQFQSMR